MKFREFKVRCGDCGLVSSSTRAMVGEEALSTADLKCTSELHHNAAGPGASRSNVRLISFVDKTLSVREVLPYGQSAPKEDWSDDDELKPPDSKSDAGLALKSYLNNTYGRKRT